jgi:hypothetical protein
MALWSSGDAITQSKINGVYTPYTPTIGAAGGSPGLGNGTLSGKWWREGQTVLFGIRLSFGSTTSFGTGQVTLTLPVAAEASGSVSLSGSGVGLDASAGTAAFPLLLTGFLLSSSTVFAIWNPAGSSNNVVTSAFPFTWTTSDVLDISGSYFAA